jgi:D-3-phosphoglycerate dehydrogenase
MAGIDVMKTEPPGDNPLLDLENCIVTPHVAWYSEASIADLQRITAEEVARVITGKEPRNLVNPAVVE